VTKIAVDLSAVAYYCTRIPAFSTTVASLIHPSPRHASIRFRRFENFVGGAAGVATLKAAMATRPRAT